MKKQCISFTFGLLFITLSVSAQVVSKDSIEALKAEKEAIKSNEKINEKKTESAKLENELIKKNEQVQKTAEAAQKSADENRKAAADLMKNPQDKKLAKDAKNAARKASKDSNAANKAVQDQESLNKQIAELKEDIGTQQVQSTASVASQASTTTTSIADQKQENVVQPTTSISSQSGVVTSNSQKQENGIPPVIVRTSMMDSSNSGRDMAQKVIDATYRNYPQQSGQPTIIINNIIVPSDYEKKGPAKEQMMQNRSADRDDEEYKQFLAWKKQRGMGPSLYNNRNSETAVQDQNRINTSGSKITWKERFGERPARNSGLWVIPMVGVHASSFNADLKDSEADGRVGWNAGLDFRIHMKRFFIQPGVHYFNSSLKQTDKDSLSNASLLNGPRIHSLKAPLMLGLYLTRANSGFFKINIKGGVVGNYVMAVDKSNIAYFSKDNIEEFSYGLNAGLGLEFGLITLDLSHEWGMSTYFKSNDQKNNVLRFTLGIKI